MCAVHDLAVGSADQRRTDELARLLIRNLQECLCRRHPLNWNAIGVMGISRTRAGDGQTCVGHQIACNDVCECDEISVLMQQEDCSRIARGRSRSTECLLSLFVLFFDQFLRVFVGLDRRWIERLFPQLDRRRGLVNDAGRRQDG